MDDKLFKLYTLAVMNYEKKFKNDMNTLEDLYPMKWDNNISYKKRIKIISESLKENKLIKDTDSYQEYLIDVKGINKN